MSTSFVSKTPIYACNSPCEYASRTCTTPRDGHIWRYVQQTLACPTFSVSLQVPISFTLSLGRRESMSDCTPFRIHHELFFCSKLSQASVTDLSQKMNQVWMPTFLCRFSSRSSRPQTTTPPPPTSPPSKASSVSFPSVAAKTNSMKPSKSTNSRKLTSSIPIMLLHLRCRSS